MIQTQFAEFPVHGLTSAEAAARLAREGPNTPLLMVLFENVQVLNSRSETVSIFHQGLFSNRFLIFAIPGAQAIHIGAMYTPGLRELLRVVPVTPCQWAQLLLVALVLIALDEVHKRVHLRRAVVANVSERG